MSVEVHLRMKFQKINNSLCVFIWGWLDVLYVPGNRRLIKYCDIYFEAKMRIINAVGQ